MDTLVHMDGRVMLNAALRSRLRPVGAPLVEAPSTEAAQELPRASVFSDPSTQALRARYFACTFSH